MSGLIILILIFIGVPYLWRFLRPYAARWAQRRTEDYLRRAMGMPPREKSGGSARNSRSRDYGASSPFGYSTRQRRRGAYSSGPIIPKEYAVDVEFTEIRSYSGDDAASSGGQRVRYKVESQVSDAEIIEIRKS